MSEPFYGEIRALPYIFAPREWAWCEGQLVNIAQNTALFAILGITFGGDGRMNFGLPDLRGRTPMHPGNAAGLTPRRWGDIGGNVTVSLETDQTGGHTHQANAAVRDKAEYSEPGEKRLPHQLIEKGGGKTMYRKCYTDDAHHLVAMSNESVGLCGSGQGHENRQPYLSVNFCISMHGIFPSRN